MNISLGTVALFVRALLKFPACREGISLEGGKMSGRAKMWVDRRESEINRYFIRGKFAAACRSRHFPHTYVRRILLRHICMYVYHTQSLQQLRMCVCLRDCRYACKHSCTYYRRKLSIRAEKRERSKQAVWLNRADINETIPGRFLKGSYYHFDNIK